MSSFDTPPAEEVFQQDDESILPVPVRIDGLVQVDPMPARIGSVRRLIFPVGALAEQIATNDPRRKCLTVNGYNTDFVLAASRDEANRFEGYILQSGFGIPTHFDYSNELWVRPVLITTTDTTFTVAASNDIGALSILIEQWAK